METATLGHWQITYRNREEFLELKKEIWTRGEYYFELEEDELEGAPTIVDVGAHIGLATLYWLNLWPAAKIIAIEANPLNVELLRENIERNNLGDQVEIVPLAMVGRGIKGEQNFYFDREGEWLMSGSLQRGAWNGQELSQEIKVNTGHLSDYLVELSRIDFLKIDVEGAEKAVLKESADQLRKVKRLMIEYHNSGKNEKARKELEELERFLEKLGFEVEVGERAGQLRMISGYNHSL